MELRNADAVQGRNWLGLAWTEWDSLHPQELDRRRVPRSPGLYRVRHVDMDDLIYIGATGRDLRGRIGHVSAKTYRDGDGADSTYTASHHLRELRGQLGDEFEVSCAAPNVCRSEIDRMGIEHALIASHIRSVGHSPAVNLDRRHRLEYATSTALENIDWSKTTDMLAEDWLGLSWREPMPLADRLNASAQRAVYRIWFPGYAPPLAYIGETIRLESRLRQHEKKFGSDALFSIAAVDGTRKEIEQVLLAQHYLNTNTLPKGQNGVRNSFVSHRGSIARQ